MKKFEITYYWGPQGENALDEEMWKAVAECGFTTVPLENGSCENNITALNLMKKYSLRCSSLMDSRIRNILEGSIQYTQAEIEEIVAKVVSDYSVCDNIDGWWLYDEPNASKFELLRRVKDAFGKFSPGKEVFIDLLPTYANNEQLGTAGYDEYLKQYVETVNPLYICYDHYHFQNGQARSGFFANMEAVRSKALDAKLDSEIVVLLTKHMSYENISKSQIEWEVNMALAYGFKRISYFTFIITEGLEADGWKNGCMNYKGEKYQHYYDVQEINKWLINLGNELFSKNSEAVFHVSKGTLEEGCEKYESYGDLGKIDGLSLLVGFFDDRSFMIVNKKYVDSEYGSNSFTLPDVASKLDYFDASQNLWKPYETRNADGIYEVTLGAGEGILMRVR